MPNRKIFCNVPWTNTHIYWDGGFGSCCMEKQRPYENDQWQQYNIKNMTIAEWHNSDPIKKIRNIMHGDSHYNGCKSCYFHESSQYGSRRIKENFKTVIFTEEAFDKSYNQSSWYERFESAKNNANQDPPVDWHIDLGNECNLACKMCGPEASSLISSKYKSWGIKTETRKNWVNNTVAWQNFIASINETKKLNRLHFMGGEPMLSKRFKELVDYLLDNNRTDLSISFVTNGTSLDLAFINKLKKFRSCDIEVSIESFEKNNHYIRQGSNTDEVVSNILKLISEQTDTFKIVLRSVPQLLNANTYHNYIKWAFDNKISVQGIPLTMPNYLSIPVLPKDIRKSFIKNYTDVITYIEQNPINTFKTLAQGRDTSRLDLQLITECKSLVNLLSAPEPDNVLEIRKELATWLMRWDKEFNLNAYEYYPEYEQFLRNIGYEA